MPGVYTHWVDKLTGSSRPAPDSYQVYIRNKLTQKIFPYTKYQHTASNVSRRVYASNDEQNKLRSTAGRWSTVTTSNIRNYEGWLRTDFSALADGSPIKSISEAQPATTDHVDPTDKVYLNPDAAVAVGNKILFEERCYSKTGGTGLMTHTLTGMPSDLIITESTPEPTPEPTAIINNLS